MRKHYSGFTPILYVHKNQVIIKEREIINIGYFWNHIIQSAKISLVRPKHKLFFVHCQSVSFSNIAITLLDSSLLFLI